MEPMTFSRSPRETKPARQMLPRVYEWSIAGTDILLEKAKTE